MAEFEAPRWEYRVLRPSRETNLKELRDPTEELNELGSAGWELVETIEYVGGGTKFLVMKRARPDSESVDE